MKNYESADVSYCFQCKNDKYCKEPRLDGQFGREIRDKETDKLLACVSSTIKQCIRDNRIFNNKN